MSYTAIDLIDKIIYIGEKNKEICCNFLKKLQENTPKYLVIKILSKNLDKSIECYKKLKEEIHSMDLEEIDFVIYDKISSLINEFSNKTIMLDTMNIKSSIESCLNFQKDVLSLFISIQGRLIKSEKDVDTKAYEILCIMIKEKGKNIGELEEFIKVYY